MRRPCPCIGLAAVGASLLALASACSDARDSASKPATAADAAAPSRAVPILSEEPWTFGAATGRVITTPSYRIFTTLGPGIISSRVPEFAETALARYRTAFGPLPPPPQTLDTYILANRPQWSRAAAQLLGTSGAAYQQIIRGGVTTGGRSILYDIGPRDTFSLIAHEGWHQYSQSTFREPLPVWLEEGIATVMEGFRWRADDPAEPEFLPWSNLERFDQLRDAVNRRTLVSLPDLLAGSPAKSIEGGSDPALTYYSQVWALTLFLSEGDGGRYSTSLAELLTDATRGTISRRVRGAQGGSPGDILRARGTGPGVFLVYFDADLDRASAAYSAFCAAVTGPKARDSAFLGRSPLPSGH